MNHLSLTFPFTIQAIGIVVLLAVCSSLRKGKSQGWEGKGREGGGILIPPPFPFPANLTHSIHWIRIDT